MITDYEGDVRPSARLAIVEDYPVVRDALAQLLNATSGLTVVASVGTVVEARAAIAREKPDALLLDLMLGGSDSLAFIAELAESNRSLKVLVLSMMSESVYAERALRAGAVGYIMKSAETSEVVNAIQSVLAGRIYLSPKIFVGLFRGLLQRSGKDSVSGISGLSDRELQVFQMIGAGIPNRSIATQLSISVKTVEAHRENLKNKLGVQDSMALKDVAENFVNTVANG